MDNRQEKYAQNWVVIVFLVIVKADRSWKIDHDSEDELFRQ